MDAVPSPKAPGSDSPTPASGSPNSTTAQPSLRPVPQIREGCASKCGSPRACMSEDPLRVIVVDDEALARRGIRQQLERHRNVRVLAECATASQAARAIAAHDPDLVFLDIQMP